MQETHWSLLTREKGDNYRAASHPSFSVATTRRHHSQPLYNTQEKCWGNCVHVMWSKMVTCSCVMIQRSLGQKHTETHKQTQHHHPLAGDFTTIGSLKVIDENRSHYQGLYPHPAESQRDAFQCAAPDVWPLFQMLVFAVFIYLPDLLRGEPWVELWG